MKHSISRFSTRPRLTALALIAGGVLAMVSACSSDNAEPSTPVITTGGGGSGGKGSSAGGDQSDGGKGTTTGGKGGGTSKAGGSNGGGENGGSAGENPTGSAGEAGEAGAGPGQYIACPPGGPTDDLGFLNAATTVQKDAFNNTARLGTHATLPVLPQ